MKYKFSPIKSKEKLLQAIGYLHIECHKLCKQVFDEYLPVAGNIGIFCHVPDEFEFLTNLRKEMTQDKNWNGKYFLLRKPIVIPGKDGVPEATYTYLYIRRLDETKPEVGDIDFVLNQERFAEFKGKSIHGIKENGVEIFYRLDLDMLRLSRPDSDVLPYITTTFMTEKGI